MTQVCKNILVAGATSLIAQETIRLFASRQQSRFVLVARSQDKLNALAEDLKARGASEVHCIAGDLSSEAFHKDLVTKAIALLGRIDLAYFAWGELGNDKSAQLNYEETARLFQVNFLSVVSLLIKTANVMEVQGAGILAVISSVAGDRGRQSNYVYGSTKAALSAYLQGLRNRLYHKGVHVVTIKPGVIKTPMTAHLKAGLLTAEAKDTGEGIYKAIVRGKSVAYVPTFWRFIMGIICLIPENLFRRLRL